MEDTPLNLIYKLGAYLRLIKTQTKEKIICSVIVVNSNSIKKFLNILFTFVESSSPHYIVDSIEKINGYIS